MTQWKHPTGNSPKSAALVCLGPSSQTYIGCNLRPDLSEEVLGCDEVWTVNRGANVFRHDLLWIMDHIQGEADKNPRYGASLWKHDKPIITSDNMDGWPSHVHSYPFNEVWNWLRTVVNPMHGDWYHNSLAYIIVYAAFIGLKELRVFGADYSNHNNGVVENGHPCVAYWVGRMESAGLLVRTTDDSAFLNSNQRSWIYGYNHDPRVIPSNRKRFQDLIGQPVDGNTIELLSGERQVAAEINQIQPDHVERYSWAAAKVSGMVLDIGCGVGYGSALMVDSNANIKGVVALDRSVESINYANNHYPRPNVSYEVADFNNFDSSKLPKSDWAVLFEIVEHLPDPKPLLKKLPCDKLVLSVPNQDRIPYSPESAPHHHRHYNMHDLGDLLSESGWKVTGWYGQRDPISPVEKYHAIHRTIVVEAERYAKRGSNAKNGKDS